MDCIWRFKGFNFALLLVKFTGANWAKAGLASAIVEHVVLGGEFAWTGVGGGVGGTGGFCIDVDMNSRRHATHCYVY